MRYNEHVPNVEYLSCISTCICTLLTTLAAGAAALVTSAAIPTLAYSLACIRQEGGGREGQDSSQ